MQYGPLRYVQTPCICGLPACFHWCVFLHVDCLKCRSTNISIKGSLGYGGFATEAQLQGKACQGALLLDISSH